MSARARSSATTGALMSAPRSKRDDASVLSASRLLVRRTEAGLKYALSSTTLFVAGDEKCRARERVLQAGLRASHEQAACAQDRSIVSLRAGRRHQRAGRGARARPCAHGAD